MGKSQSQSTRWDEGGEGGAGEFKITVDFRTLLSVTLEAADKVLPSVRGRGHSRAPASEASLACEPGGCLEANQGPGTPGDAGAAGGRPHTAGRQGRRSHRVGTQHPPAAALGIARKGSHLPGGPAARRETGKTPDPPVTSGKAPSRRAPRRSRPGGLCAPPRPAAPRLRSRPQPRGGGRAAPGVPRPPPASRPEPLLHAPPAPGPRAPPPPRACTCDPAFARVPSSSACSVRLAPLSPGPGAVPSLSRRGLGENAVARGAPLPG
uniref:basic proline-rich protein-like n=1 Tax=Nyctereutes procyonoides TaxID=34880 RepID=UPI00244538C3|nr:basic proline-rich protein-like [Nyctereutes procyonoides]